MGKKCCKSNRYRDKIQHVKVPFEISNIRGGIVNGGWDQRLLKGPKQVLLISVLWDGSPRIIIIKQGISGF